MEKCDYDGDREKIATEMYFVGLLGKERFI